MTETEEAYARWHVYWAGVISEVEREHGQLGKWPRWIPQLNPAGRPTPLEYRYIADGYSRELHRGYRLSQVFEPAELEEYLAASASGAKRLGAFVARFPREYSHLPPLCLTMQVGDPEAEVELVRALLRRWMNPTMDDQAVERFIMELRGLAVIWIWEASAADRAELEALDPHHVVLTELGRWLAVAFVDEPFARSEAVIGTLRSVRVHWTEIDADLAVTVYRDRQPIAVFGGPNDEREDDPLSAAEDRKRALLAAGLTIDAAAFDPDEIDGQRIARYLGIPGDPSAPWS